LRFYFVHSLLSYNYIKNGLFGIAMIEQKLICVYGNTVGLRHSTFRGSPFVGTLLPLSFSDRSFLIAPIFIKDFSLQRLCICYLYMYNRMKNIYPKLYLRVSCRDFYISVFQLQLLTKIFNVFERIGRQAETYTPLF